MRYLGGKSRIATQLALLMNNLEGGQEFVSLFCGSCAVESKVNYPKKILNDKHPYLIAMWKGLQDGWRPPNIITKQDYKYIKSHKEENPPLTGFVGFGCSFGGKWFGGMARNKKGDNYCAGAEKSLLKDFKGVKDAIFTCLDYKDVPIKDGSIVYADPPYIGTTGYTVGTFDTNEFWEYMRKISAKNYVFISEQTAPEDFIAIWEKPFTRMLDSNKDNIFVTTEKLFVYKYGLIKGENKNV